MRKDVKLGLAVGGVLLAVLVVYVLVAPGSNQTPVAFDGGDGETVASETTQGGAETGAPGDAIATNANTTDGATGQGAPGGTGADTQDQQAKSNGGASNAATGSTAGNGQSAGEKPTADTGWNWDALVNGTEKVPSLMSPTELATGAGTTGASRSSGATGAGGATGTGGATGGANGSRSANGAGAGTPASGATAPGLPTNTLAGATQAGSTQPPAQPTGVPSNPTDNLAQGTRPVAGGRTHVVKVGETFSSIAAAAYGSPNFYPHIQRANPSVDSTRLKPGMTITLPSIDEVKPAASPAVPVTEQKVDSRTQYKVQPNDSLYRISEKLYGKADRVEKLYQANKALIGDDMAQVKVGMILTLPEPPTQSTEAATAR